MKKVIYGLTILCLMFYGITNVNALGSVKVDTQVIEVKQGESATFKIIVDNALARANISSDNNKMVTVEEEGIWLSEGAGKNRTIEHEITINAVGKAGTTNVLVDLFDASTYDGESIATRNNPVKYMITVKVLPSGIDFLTILLVGVILVLTFGGYIYLYRKNSK